MDETVNRIVERRFPELAGQYHLPRFAQVIAVADPPAEKGLCDDFRPRYAVDLVVLSPDGEPDPDLPHLLGVPLPVPAGGNEAGFYGFPEEGTTVVISFAYGLPSKPFIQQILPHGLSLPRVPKGDQVWQHSEGAQQRVDADGNWVRQTDGKIVDKAVEREVKALDNVERYQSHRVEVEDHSTEMVAGVKQIEAVGALQLLSGGSASLAAVDDIHQATGRDLNLAVGRRLNVVVGDNWSEQVQGMLTSVAQVSQRIQAPQMWVGSETTNLLKILSDLLEIVLDMNLKLAYHKHGPTPSPDISGDLTSLASASASLIEELSPITL